MTVDNRRIGEDIGVIGGVENGHRIVKAAESGVGALELEI